MITRGLRPLNEADRQSQFPAQLCFFARHLTIIALMIEACQMEQAVEGEDLDLLSGGVAEAQCVLSGDISRDSDLSGHIFFSVPFGREGQDIGRLILVTEFAVEGSDSRTAGDENVDAAPNADGSTGPEDEAL